MWCCILNEKYISLELLAGNTLESTLLTALAHLIASGYLCRMEIVKAELNECHKLYEIITVYWSFQWISVVEAKQMADDDELSGRCLDASKRPNFAVGRLFGAKKRLAFIFCSSSSFQTCDDSTFGPSIFVCLFGGMRWRASFSKIQHTCLTQSSFVPKQTFFIPKHKCPLNSLDVLDKTFLSNWPTKSPLI